MSPPRDSDRTGPSSGSGYRADETPVEAVVAAIAETTGQSPLAMTPLGEVVDTDALNMLFDDDGRSSSVTVDFDYSGHRVSVTSDGVRVTPPNGQR